MKMEDQHVVDLLAPDITMFSMKRIRILEAQMIIDRFVVPVE
jgi:hypothetical protein